MSMRRLALALALALASACVFVASCSSSHTPAPVAADALKGLLLSPAEINSALGANGMAAERTLSDLSDNSANIPDEDCRFIVPAESSVYRGSGWSAVRSQYLHGPAYDHEVWQAVVSFPSADDAERFFSASAQRWWACANREFHYVYPGQPDKVWTVGPIALTNNTLSATETRNGGNGWACQRALTVRNNVVIDITACSVKPAYAAVFNIVDKIAAKVAKR